MIKTIFIFIPFGILVADEIWSQAIYFNKTYNYNNEITTSSSVLAAESNGYLCAGMVVTSFFRGYYLLRTDSLGDTLWTKLYSGGDSTAYINGYSQSFVKTDNGEFLQCGAYVDYKNAIWDGLLMRIKANGDTVWTKRYGGIYEEGFTACMENDDGTIIITGGTKAPSSGANTDIFLVKTDSSGNMLWQKNYGGIGTDEALTLINTPDGGYLLVGYTNSYGAGSYDVYVVKTDSVGNKQWQKTFGSSLTDGGGDLQYLRWQLYYHRDCIYCKFVPTRLYY